MIVPVNPNIDEFKDDFYKGLTLKQTVISCVSICAGVAAFLFWYVFLGMPQSVSLYLTLPVVFPIAAAGFLRIKGMNPVDYFQRKRKVKRNYIFHFHPDMLLESMSFRTDIAGVERTEKSMQRKNKKTRKIYLETEETISLVEQNYQAGTKGENTHEIDERL